MDWPLLFPEAVGYSATSLPTGQPHRLAGWPAGWMVGRPYWNRPRRGTYWLVLPPHISISAQERRSSSKVHYVRRLDPPPPALVWLGHWVAAEVNTFDFWPSQARPGLSVPALKSSLVFFFWFARNWKAKGQIISKGLFGILGFFQKMNELIRFLVLLGKKTEFVRSFFGRIRGYQKSFRNYLTFKACIIIQ